MAAGFEVDGVGIPAPTKYQPVFATTSTEDSDRTQDLIMHNTPMGTISGYNMQWDSLDSSQISTILNSMLNKPSFNFRHRDPTASGGWSIGVFYASNFSMNAQRLKEGNELWDGLQINVRSTYPNLINM